MGLAASLSSQLRRLTASGAAGGMMLAGIPLALDYVVRPGDTLSGIAERHQTTVQRLVDRNHLHPSGDRILAGQRLQVPGGHNRDRQRSRGRRADPDARRIVRYTVRPGDTPSGLAVRFRAWTAEVIELNGPVLRVGEEIRIPVVVAAVREDRRTRSRAPAPRRSSHRSGDHRSAGPSRAEVRTAITRAARRHGVDPDLALAVSWQEAGWQMHHRSHAGAVGAMQVIPSTGRWMSDVVGRRLHLGNLHDNVTAGVVLLDLLLDRAPTRVAVAGYYQGLAGVRRHGMYDDTRRYVANVMALRHRFANGRYPA